MSFFSSGRNVAGELLQMDDDKLRWLERSEADEDVHDTEVDVVLRRRLAEQVVHESADVQD